MEQSRLCTSTPSREGSCWLSWQLQGTYFTGFPKAMLSSCGKGEAPQESPHSTQHRPLAGRPHSPPELPQSCHSAQQPPDSSLVSVPGSRRQQFSSSCSRHVEAPPRAAAAWAQYPAPSFLHSGLEESQAIRSIHYPKLKLLYLQVPAGQSSLEAWDVSAAEQQGQEAERQLLPRGIQRT